MNKIILMGRLTRDPEVSYSNADNSTALARFNLAVDRRFKRAGDSTEADFFNCIAFGKQAEFVEKYLKKGTKILLTGRIQNNNYTNKEGQKIYSMQIIAEEMEFAESKSASGNNNDTEDQRPRPAAEESGFYSIPDGVEDEELPFNQGEGK